jgi:hypothetical protein
MQFSPVLKGGDSFSKRRHLYLIQVTTDITVVLGTLRTLTSVIENSSDC